MGYMDNNGLLYFWTKLKTIFIRKINNVGPDSNGNVSLTIPDPATATPIRDGTAAVGASTKYAREDHVHPTDTTRAASSHTHGNITNAGALQTSDVTVASGDKLVITDSSNSGKVARTSITFDGTTETKALTPKGTWVDIPVPIEIQYLTLPSGTTTYDSNGYVSQSTGTKTFTDIQTKLSNGITVVLAFVSNSGDRFYLFPAGEDTLNTVLYFTSNMMDSGIGGAGLFYSLQLDSTNAFTLTRGVLKAATQASTDNSTKVATTAFVQSLISAGTKVEIKPITVSSGADGHYTGTISENWSEVYNRIVNGTLVVLDWAISSTERYLFYPTESTVTSTQAGVKEITFATVPYGTNMSIFQYVLVGNYTTTAFTIDENYIYGHSPYTSNPKMDGTVSPGISAEFARGDHVHPTDTSRAPLASPALTGTPTAPTPTSTSGDTQIATKKYVDDKAASIVVPLPSDSNPQMDGTAAPGTSPAYSRYDHVHPKDTSKANLASPTFTGTPKAPTAAAGTNNTQIATTAFVKTAVDSAVASAISGVASFKGAATAQSTIDGTANIQTGWYWVVQTAGTYYGQDCESGDFIYVTASSPIRDPQDNTKWAASNFTMIQTNITPMTNSEIDTIVAS